VSTTAASFYQTGGTLRPDAPSYVERQADRDLYEGLSGGEFCYVLTARQMGKSSLMVRTAARLREDGVAVVVLDLTAIGQNLSPEQWYDGLLARMGDQLDLETELEAFWLSRERLGPLQRWVAALREVVLARRPGRLVVFVDELDVVRSLPFPSDEFFAGIRECYNRRSGDPEFGRLTFCLLGVASPSDLIRDARLTPFNIGRRIELTDFTEPEARPLAAGLGRNEPLGVGLLDRILDWTGGHPYLTQRLCQAVSGDRRVTAAAGVDRHCEVLFLSSQAQERDDNLLFVRDYLLRSGADPAGLLELYGQVRRGKRVRADETNPRVSVLRLSGIVRVVGGWLRVRNRIYARVFDGGWVTEHMPDAELRRQRAAYRRGWVRASVLLGLILAMVGSLALTAVRTASRARLLAEARRQALVQSRRLLYVAQMNLAMQAWEVGDIGRGRSLVEAQRPRQGQEELRGFEWRYLWRLCQGDARATLRGHSGPVRSIAFARDGRILASCSDDHTIKLWDIATRREIFTLRGHRAGVNSMAFCPDGTTLASGGDDKTVRLWDIRTRREEAILSGHTGSIICAAFSPDGKTLATGGKDRTIRLWDVGRRRAVAVLNPAISVHGLAFSPDGKRLAADGSHTGVQLWDVAAQQKIATLPTTGWPYTVAFSPDGAIVAAGAQTWDAATHQETTTLQGHAGDINGIAFAPDSRTVASGGDDGTVRVWNTVTGREVTTFRGHTAQVYTVAFSPDGKTLASGGEDGTIKLWDRAAARNGGLLEGSMGWVSSVAFSPDGRTLVSGGAGAVGGASVRLWDVATGRVLATFRGHSDWVPGVAFSPDGKSVASASADKTVRLWDVVSGKPGSILRGHTGGVWVVAFSPEGKILATGSEDHTVKLWDVAVVLPPGGAREVATLRGVSGFHNSIAFSPDGTILATAMRDNSVKLWDVRSDRGILTVPAPAHDIPPDKIQGVRFSPDGTILATGWPDRTARLWDLTAGREIATLKGHATSIATVAFSPDGKTLATGSGDGTVKLWNVAMRQEVATLKGHTTTVTTVAFSPDGNTLATASGDTTVRLWRAAPFVETDAQAHTPGHPAPP
jgi:WD40 repeat protein